MTKRKAPAPAGPEHTADCIEARGGPDRWPNVWELAQRAAPVTGLGAALAVALVKAIDACPHPAHDSYRLMFGKSRPEELAARAREEVPA